MTIFVDVVSMLLIYWMYMIDKGGDDYDAL